MIAEHINFAANAKTALLEEDGSVYISAISFIYFFLFKNNKY